MRSDKSIIKGMKREHDRLIEMGREVDTENARLQERVEEVEGHWKRCEECWNKVIKQAEGFLALAERRKKALNLAESELHHTKKHMKVAFEDCHAATCRDARAAIEEEIGVKEDEQSDG